MTFFFGKEEIASWFAQDEDGVLQIVSSVLPIYALAVLGALGTINGVIFALELQKYSAIPAIIVQYFIYLPLAILLGIK